MKVGDLAITQDMGTHSGRVVLILKVNVFDAGKLSMTGHRHQEEWVTYDILDGGTILDGVDSSFLIAVPDEAG
jgi:hypothetical protein